ncbi:hypothetical protein TSUD_228490 [Trifolium subterraneum]|uniref:Uncharacterized protein n=1 Tax=Trifolium subterraneum TaxID=3900 RepID=A0A2Z6LLP6_TRISU|nr:hypothetical protein TSUD_228490 [Trifolium subterraneum]
MILDPVNVVEMVDSRYYAFTRIPYLKDTITQNNVFVTVLSFLLQLTGHDRHGIQYIANIPLQRQRYNSPVISNCTKSEYLKLEVPNFD